MKLIRSKIPVTIPHRSGTKKGIVAVYISEWKWFDRSEVYQAEITDFEVIDILDPNPGSNKKSYLKISQEPRTRTKAEIDGMFNAIGVDVKSHDANGVPLSYSDQNRDIRVNGLLMETQMEPIRDSNPEDWEIIDTENEFVPNE